MSYFHVRDELEGQSLKSDAARRRVPLHSALIDIGILDHIQQLRASGAERLFPDLHSDKDGYFSARPSRFYQRVLARIADPEPDDPGKLTFHSSRHTVMTRLRNAEVRQDVSREIVGHQQEDVHAGYGTYSIPTLKRAVDQISYEELDLTPLRLPKPKS